MTAEVNKAAAMLMLNTSLFPFSASARFLIPSALHVMIHERLLFCVLALLLSTAGEYGLPQQSAERPGGTRCPDKGSGNSTRARKENEYAMLGCDCFSSLQIHRLHIQAR